MADARHGTFLRGVYTGIESKEGSNFKKLCVRTFDSEAGYVDKIDFRAFDPNTGERLFDPETVTVGSVIECKVFAKAKHVVRAAKFNDQGVEVQPAGEWDFIVYSLMACEVLQPA